MSQDETDDNVEPAWTGIPLEIYTASLICLGVGIFFGNLLVIWLFGKFKKLRTVTNVWITSLATSDLLVAVLLIPVFIVCDNEGVGPYFIAFILFANLLNLCGVTFDRYKAVLAPLHYKGTMTKGKVYKTLVYIWTSPLVITLIPLAWEFTVEEVRQTATRVYSGILLSSVALTSAGVTWAYFKIFREAKRNYKGKGNLRKLKRYITNAEQDGDREEAIRQFRNENKTFHSLCLEVNAAKVFACVGILFALGWYPLVILNLFVVIGRTDLVLPQILQASLYSLVGNSLFNPAIYSLCKSDFRKALKSLFKQARMKLPLWEFSRRTMTTDIGGSEVHDKHEAGKTKAEINQTPKVASEVRITVNQEIEHTKV